MQINHYPNKSTLLNVSGVYFSNEKQDLLISNRGNELRNAKAVWQVINYDYFSPSSKIGTGIFGTKLIKKSEEITIRK